MHHIAKKKNRYYLPIFYPRIGNKIIVRLEAIQLHNVENGTIFELTIYGIYNQTTGPNVNPKNSIKKNKQAIIIIYC